VFQNEIQQDAAWQSAFERVFIHADGATDVSRSHPPSLIRNFKVYHFKRFPELFRAMCDNEPTSRVRCDGFDPGHPWREEQIAHIVETNQTGTLGS